MSKKNAMATFESNALVRIPLMIFDSFDITL